MQRTGPARNVQLLNDLEVFAQENIALGDSHRSRGPRRQLERSDSTARRGDPPGAQPMPYRDDLPITVQKYDIDSEPHEEHVHGWRSVQEHPAARIETVATEQYTHPPE